MSESYYDKSELQDTDSDYICLFCHTLLYENVQAKKEICANQSCVVGQVDPKFIRYGQNSTDLEKSQFDYCKILHKFYLFSKSFLYHTMFEKRSQFCTDYLSGKEVSIHHMLSVDFILVHLSDNQNWGTSTDKITLDKLFEEIVKEHKYVKKLEEFKSQDYLIDERKDVYVMKYLTEIHNIQKSLGLISHDESTHNDVNKFNFINKQVRTREPSSLADFETLFKNIYELAINLNHFFKFGHYTSLIHDYPAKSIDFAVLYSLLVESISKGECFFTENELKQKFDVLKQRNKLSGDYDTFFKQYCSGDKLAPILIFDGNNLYFDYSSLLLFLFYLFSLNHTIEGAHRLSGHDTLMKQRQVSAHNFEIEIRKKLRNDSFTVYPKNDNDEFAPSINGTRHEYDCVGIDTVKKIIIMIDAKYEDISPSSTTAENVLKHTILAKKDGHLKHAIDQHTRKKFLRKNFREILPDLNDNLCNYTIISIIVTKHIPLIKKYLSTHLMSYEQFVKTDFRQEIL